MEERLLPLTRKKQGVPHSLEERPAQPSRTNKVGRDPGSKSNKLSKVGNTLPSPSPALQHKLKLFVVAGPVCVYLYNFACSALLSSSWDRFSLVSAFLSLQYENKSRVKKTRLHSNPVEFGRWNYPFSFSNLGYHHFWPLLDKSPRRINAFSFFEIQHWPFWVYGCNKQEQKTDVHAGGQCDSVTVWSTRPAKERKRKKNAGTRTSLSQIINIQQSHVQKGKGTTTCCWGRVE